ncbi:MAG: hypothetical protein ACLFV5_08065 [Anaerolineales bacterium]
MSTKNTTEQVKSSCGIRGPCVWTGDAAGDGPTMVGSAFRYLSEVGVDIVSVFSDIPPSVGVASFTGVAETFSGVASEDIVAGSVGISVAGVVALTCGVSLVGCS